MFYLIFQQYLLRLSKNQQVVILKDKAHLLQAQPGQLVGRQRHQVLAVDDDVARTTAADDVAADENAAAVAQLNIHARFGANREIVVSIVVEIGAVDR